MYNCATMDIEYDCNILQLWAGRKTLVHRAAGRFLAFSFLEAFMADKILSIFIDESGDFGPFETHNPYYLVAMVAHNFGRNWIGRCIG